MSGVLACFEKMCRRNGGYSLPWLITLHDDANTIVMRFVNNTADVTYDGNVYSAGTFQYTPNADDNGFDGGGQLEIAIQNNQVIDLIETYRSIRLDVAGTLCEDGTVTAIKTFKHHYGAVSVDAKKATFTFEADDRLNMTFPALMWSTQNNRGNA